MTQLGKVIITSGIVILTLSALMWIILDNWQYLAGGAAVFVGCFVSGIVLSIETKNPHPSNGGGRSTNYAPPPEYHLPPSRVRDTEKNTINDTDPYPTTPISGNWSPPDTPPPDADQDPFYGKKTDV